MKKPTVYLDTNVVSVLHYAGQDIAVIARQMAPESIPQVRFNQTIRRKSDD